MCIRKGIERFFNNKEKITIYIEITSLYNIVKNIMINEERERQNEKENYINIINYYFSNYIN